MNRISSYSYPFDWFLGFWKFAFSWLNNIFGLVWQCFSIFPKNCATTRRTWPYFRSGKHGRRAMCNLTNSGHGIKPGQIDFSEGCLGQRPRIEDTQTNLTTVWHVIQKPPWGMASIQVQNVGKAISPSATLKNNKYISILVFLIQKSKNKTEKAFSDS